MNWMDWMEDLEDWIFSGLDDRVDSIFGGGNTPSRARHHVETSKDKVTLWVEVPGLTAKDVKITLDGCILQVVAKGSPVAGQDQHISKDFRVSEDIDPDKIEAFVKDGLLKVVLHSKPEEKPQKVKIEVKGA